MTTQIIRNEFNEIQVGNFCQFGVRKAAGISCDGATPEVSFGTYNYYIANCNLEVNGVKYVDGFLHPDGYYTYHSEDRSDYYGFGTNYNWDENRSDYVGIGADYDWDEEVFYFTNMTGSPKKVKVIQTFNLDQYWEYWTIPSNENTTLKIDEMESVFQFCLSPQAQEVYHPPEPT